MGGRLSTNPHLPTAGRYETPGVRICGDKEHAQSIAAFTNLQTGYSGIIQRYSELFRLTPAVGSGMIHERWYREHTWFIPRARLRR